MTPPRLVGWVVVPGQAASLHEPRRVLATPAKMAVAVIHHRFASEAQFRQERLQSGATSITVAEFRQVVLRARQVHTHDVSEYAME